MSRWRTLGPAVAVGVAVIGGVALSRGDDRIDTPPTPTAPAPVEIISDAPHFATLGELVGASDIVVRATVTRTARGRVFGDPDGGTAIESRLVTLQVSRVIRGDASGDLLLEEEGWTLDGAPLVVDGAAPSRVGDDAIWFLTEVEGPEGPAYVTVSAQGRYIVDGDHLQGAAGVDPLVADLSARSPRELAELIDLMPS